MDKDLGNKIRQAIKVLSTPEERGTKGSKDIEAIDTVLNLRRSFFPKLEQAIKDDSVKKLKRLLLLGSDRLAKVYVEKAFSQADPVESKTIAYKAEKIIKISGVVYLSMKYGRPRDVEWLINKGQNQVEAFSKDIIKLAQRRADIEKTRKSVEK